LATPWRLDHSAPQAANPPTMTAGLPAHRDKGTDAMRRAGANDYRVFSARGENPASAGMRMRSGPMCPIAHTLKFKLARTHSFFTVGSCFAREVEAALTDLGVGLAGSDAVFPWAWFDPKMQSMPGKAAGPDVAETRPRSPLNRYSTHSILYDIERVFENAHTFDQTVVPLVGDDEIWDPQIKNLRYGDRAFTLSGRAVLDRAIASLATAKVVIMTLGMTETWYDEDTGAILPTPPHPFQIKRFPGRFSFFNADHPQVTAALQAIIAKIGVHNPNEPWIIVTVSPVPMGSTFTAKDVIVANTYSKATLVSAAQAVAGAYEQVDYFPSYEMITHSSRDIWFPDAIHIRPEYVAQVMKAFIGCYLDG
jgi:hypothetical protein